MRIALIVYLLFVAGICGALLYAGPVSQAIFGHDLFCLMEGAWKICNGAVPYVDFATFHGPIPHLLVAAAMALTGPTADAMPISVILGLVPVSLLAWYVFSLRMNPWFCLLTCTYLVLVWASPFPLHHDYYYRSYGMIYNRQSYVILSILMGVLLQETERNFFLTGLLLALLLFFKIPYFIAGIILCFFPVVFSPLSKKNLWQVLTGFAVIALPMTLFLRGPIGLIDMFHVFYQTAETRTGDEIQTGENLVYGELHATAYLLAFVVFCLARFHWASSIGDKSRLSNLPSPIKLIAEFECIILASVVAELGGYPGGRFFDMPLLAVYSVVLLNRLIAHATYRFDFSENTFFILGGLCCLIVVLPLWMRCFYGVGQVVVDRTSPLIFSNKTNVDAPGFKDIEFWNTCGTYPRHVSYTVKINDGLHLIENHHELDSSRIATLDFSDPFSLPLQRPPPRYMPVCLTFGYNVSETIQPDPAIIFAGCDALMIPKFPDTTEYTVVVLRRAYKDYLASHFVEIDQTRLWTLYKRR